MKKPVPAMATRKSSSNEGDWRPRVYVVQKGDTLFSFAFNYGLDYHEIADLNNIPNPSLIHIGQEIRLFPSASVTSPPVTSEIKPIQESGSQEPPTKTQPIAIKLPYSAQAAAQIEKIQGAPGKPVDKVEIRPETRAGTKNENADESNESVLVWSMPAIGELVGEFSESANRKGIDIAGKKGQPIMSSAAGKVVYSGSGLRGYGKLVIIKHNETYLSAYAHNDRVLVKEGQNVSKGQKIAEMGSTDSDRVKLHFEIRKLGKPVDPAKFLSLTKS